MAVQLSGQVGVELIERAWDVVFEEPARAFGVGAAGLIWSLPGALLWACGGAKSGICMLYLRY